MTIKVKWRGSILPGHTHDTRDPKSLASGAKDREFKLLSGGFVSLWGSRKPPQAQDLPTLATGSCLTK